MRHTLPLDPGRALAEQPGTGHNRWHPAISPALELEPGDEFELQTRDALDGQIGPGSTVGDVARLDIGRVHPLTGPVFVKGAEPGDLLEVEILVVEPAAFGFTVQSPGFGFLRHEFDRPFLARWELADGYARSDDVPGVTIPGAAFMGVMGVAPSHALMEASTQRECRFPIADLPDPQGAVPDAARDGLRTIAPRENAGNIDIKELGAGSRLFVPVFVDGALLSVGDAHFAQGDGEVCGQAIEMRATLRARVHLRKAEGHHGMRFEGVTAPRGGTYFATTGLGPGEDLTSAARNATSAMVEHLVSDRGFTREQAYTLCSVAVDLRISQAVDLPNVLVSAMLPLDIFD
jgi:formamidase